MSLFLTKRLAGSVVSIEDASRGYRSSLSDIPEGRAFAPSCSMEQMTRQSQAESFSVIRSTGPIARSMKPFDRIGIRSIFWRSPYNAHATADRVPDDQIKLGPG